MTDRGVSPVFGVVLMIALSVVLAVTLGAIVVPFIENTEAPANAAVSVSGTDVTVTSLGGGTTGVYCSDGPDTADSPSESVGIGQTIEDCEGSVIATGPNVSDTVIRT